MPFIANTPESLVARSDSRNPSTTCRGITSSGRTCRRRISPSGLDQKAVGGNRHFGSRLRVDDPRDERLYCWQHKEQASTSARSSPGPQTSPSPILEERTSLDTLADRLNLLSMTDGYGGKRTTGGAGVRPSTSLKSPGARTQRPRSKTSRTAFFCFCFEIPSDEASLPSPRPRPQPAQLSGISSSSGSAHVAHARGKGKQTVEQTYRDRTSPRSHHHQPGSRKPSTASRTAQYLALVPKTVSPQTASSLMAELAKPFSQVDEPGYIYMFWLTPESLQVAPPTEAARSLLLPPTRPDGGDWRRASDIVASFAAGGVSGNNGGGIDRGDSRSERRSNADGESVTKVMNRSTEKNSALLLKIGRANNVQRRLNEWTRQCGYKLSLIRFYPYIPSTLRSLGMSSEVVPRKIPHSHKVERLIHLELAGLGLRVADGDRCGVCGREHREWFRVEASRKAIADVDSIIRRWVHWDEGRP